MPPVPPHPWLALARREIGPIAALLTLAGLGLTFWHIAEEMGEGETHRFDSALIYALRVPGDPARPIGPPWLVQAAMDATALGSITVLSLVVLLVGGLFVALGRARSGAILLLAAFSGMLLSEGLKGVFARERPPLLLHVVGATHASFPSGHAMLSAVVFLTLGSLTARFSGRRRVRLYALACAVGLSLLVGSSRVYLGVHWPTDVIAGWCVGSAWAIVWWGGALVWQRARG